MTYYVTYKIDCRYTAIIEARDYQEALDKAEESYVDADFGEASDICGEPVVVEDECGMIFWEKP